MSFWLGLGIGLVAGVVGIAGVVYAFLVYYAAKLEED